MYVVFSSAKRVWRKKGRELGEGISEFKYSKVRGEDCQS
jgi:hypothetical protein